MPPHPCLPSRCQGPLRTVEPHHVHLHNARAQRGTWHIVGARAGLLMSGKMNKISPSSTSSCLVPSLSPFFPASEGSWGQGSLSQSALHCQKEHRRDLVYKAPLREPHGSSLTVGKLTSCSKCLVFPPSTIELSPKRKVFSSHFEKWFFD